MLKKEDAIKRETEMRTDGGPRHTYTFMCKYKDCNKTIRARSDSLKKATGFCKIHAQQKRPYESLFEGLKNDHRKPEITLTYEEFIEFTNIKNCFYCNASIPWIPYSTVEGNFKSRAYYLDRKLNDGPYSKDNCAVCCSRCNVFKRDLDINEFIVLCKLISDKHFNSLFNKPKSE